MQDVSTTYTTLLESGAAWYEIRLLINGVTYTKSQIFSLETDINVFGDNGEPTIGRAIARTLNCSVLNVNQNIPSMAEVRPQYCITNGTVTSEWITKGVFYIDSKDTGYAERRINIEAFDAMMKADTDYTSSSLSFPANDVAVVTEIASQMGVSIDSRTLSIMGAGYNNVPLPTQYTKREVLANIAACYAGCFCMSDEGKLLLVTLDGLPDASGLLVNEERRNITIDGGGIVV